VTGKILLMIALNPDVTTVISDSPREGPGKRATIHVMGTMSHFYDFPTLPAKLFDPRALTRETSANMIWPVILYKPGTDIAKVLDTRIEEVSFNVSMATASSALQFHAMG
jgi:hypothetical protein